MPGAPEVLLCSGSLPVLDGEAVLVRFVIRARGKTDGHVPPANANNDDDDRYCVEMS